MRKILIGRGFPDLVLISRIAPRILFAELKMTWGEITQEQIEWGSLLQAINQSTPAIEYHLWTPNDMTQIQQTLKTQPNPHQQAAFAQAITHFQGLNRR